MGEWMQRWVKGMDSWKTGGLKGWMDGLVGWVDDRWMMGCMDRLVDELVLESSDSMFAASSIH